MFELRSLENGYEFLDDCPEDLLGELIGFSDGSLRARVRGIVQWRDALLGGGLPPEDVWPPPQIAGSARAALTSLGLPAFCKGQPELVERVLRGLLRSFSSSERAFSDDVLKRLAELEALEESRLQDESKQKSRVRQTSSLRLEQLREIAIREVSNREPVADATLVSEWAEPVRLWSAIFDVFADLGQMMGLGWDLSLGILRHVGWENLLELKRLLDRLPQVQEIVRQLGRLHHREEADSVVEKVFSPVSRLEEEYRNTPTPLAPHEVRGIERSGEISRMLPSEALLLGHPVLKLLWHARRAERALVTYQVEGVMLETVMVERESQQESEQRRPSQERGPIIAVIDTSGSMHGLPERVAKALVLEAARIAHAEKRPCYLYSYSGPGQIVERELDLSPAGLGGLLDFFSLTFGGGNDETGVMRRVLSRLREAQWKRADVIFVSDGEWPVSSVLEAEVRVAREAGTRFHGVQIGNEGTTGLHRLCDPVHVFKSWLSAGAW